MAELEGKKADLDLGAGEEIFLNPALSKIPFVESFKELQKKLEYKESFYKNLEEVISLPEKKNFLSKPSLLHGLPGTGKSTFLELFKEEIIIEKSLAPLASTSESISALFSGLTRKPRELNAPEEVEVAALKLELDPKGEYAVAFKRFEFDMRCIAGSLGDAFLEFVNLIRTEVARERATNTDQPHLDLFRKIHSFVWRESLRLEAPDRLEEGREKLHALLRGTGSPDETKAFFNGRYQIDTVPFGRTTDTARGQEAYDQALHIMRLADDVSHGFGAFQYLAMKDPISGKVPLHAATEALGGYVKTVCDTAAFSGHGWALAGLDPASFLVSTPGSDPFSHYKAAWPWAGNSIEAFADTHFVMTRGFMAVLPPDSESYWLQGVHYGLVVYNDHFGNPSKEGGFLVPMEHIRKSLNEKDFEALSPQRLSSGIGIRGGEVLNLSWASNIGGLCNAYMPFSTRLHGWEHDLASYETHDRNGHFHKTHMNGGFKPREIVLDPKFQALQEAHREVYQLAREQFALLQLLFRGVDSWSKGLTVSPAEVDLTFERKEEAVPDEADKDPYTIEELITDERERERTAVPEYEALPGEEYAPDISSIPLLNLSRSWLEAKRNGFVSSDLCPVLVACDVARLSAPPLTDSPRLDTSDFSFTLSDGTRITSTSFEDVERLFLKYFGKFLGDTRVALRPLHRANL